MNRFPCCIRIDKGDLGINNLQRLRGYGWLRPAASHLERSGEAVMGFSADGKYPPTHVVTLRWPSVVKYSDTVKVRDMISQAVLYQRG